MVDFNNLEVAFSSKSKSELKNALLLFNTIKRPGMVKFLKGASNLALKIGFPIGWAVKPTLYKQFVGGETLEPQRSRRNSRLTRRDLPHSAREPMTTM